MTSKKSFSTDISLLESSHSSRTSSPIVPGNNLLDALVPASATSSFTSLNRLTEDGLGFLEPILDAQSNNHEDEYTRIDELQLASGMERTIEVCYCPLIEPATDDYRAGRFTKRNFRPLFSFSIMYSIDKDHTTVQCRAKVATSFIEVIPKELNFGDTDVGQLKFRQKLKFISYPKYFHAPKLWSRYLLFNPPKSKLTFNPVISTQTTKNKSPLPTCRIVKMIKSWIFDELISINIE